MPRNLSLFESDRMTLRAALELTAQSLTVYGSQYEHWVIAYSGGKDSSAVVTTVVWLIEQGWIKAPKTLTVIYADTRLEMPPLFAVAMKILGELRARGVETRIVMPHLDDRFYVYILGRGVPPSSNTFRWCTSQIKIEPIEAALAELRQQYGKKFLTLTGVRIGESAARDQKIAMSCGKNNSECGQGWLQESTPDHVSDTLAALLHWRLCHVWDWLTGLHDIEPAHGFSTALVAQVYGQDEDLETHARTGCIACPLASKDFALIEIVRRAQWAHFSPLLELRAVYAEFKKPWNRLRKVGAELTQAGDLVANPNRMGPIIHSTRRWGLERVKDIQSRAGVDLINAEEEARILELIEAKTWPNGWDGTEPLASEPFDEIMRDGSIQPRLIMT